MADLKKELALVETQIKNLTTQKSKIIHSLEEEYKNKIANFLAEKEEPFGSVSFDDITFTYPKRVKWDEKKLADLCAEIASDGENPSEYIKISYDVEENKFKAWPENIKKAFMPARTVSVGNVSVKLKLED